MYYSWSFAITLAIAIAIVGPGASGYALHRTQITEIPPSTELPSDEPSWLQATDKIRISNDSISKSVNANRTTINNKTSTTADNILTTQINTLVTSSIYSTTTTERTTAAETTTEDTRIPTISSDTVEVFDSVEDTKFYGAKETNTSDKSIQFEDAGSQITKAALDNHEAETISLNIDKTQLPVEYANVISNSNGSGEYPETETEAQYFTTNQKFAQDYAVTGLPTTTVTGTDILAETVMGESNASKTELLFITTTLPLTAISKIGNDNTIPMSDRNITIDAITVDDDKNIVPDRRNVSELKNTTADETKIKTTYQFSAKYPKYSTIIRKRTTSYDETTAQDEVMNVATSNTQVSFGKAFDVTSIPSLEKQRVELLSNTYLPTPIGTPLVSEETQKVTQILTTPYTQVLITLQNTVPKKIGTVETKRAGYLDNSEKNTPYTISSISENTEEKATDSYRASDDNYQETAVINEMNTGSPIYNKVSGLESQSQLAEDAIQEELMKEEAFNNNKENALRYHDDKTGLYAMKPDNSDVSSVPNTDEALSVQPIERMKTTLYTVSPNYKPMKKIDVQPAKQFVRDPDDNSWRNESISSLGIVFKPKNSSKSFKEVLKNKTQTELNSILGRSKENDVPDLRVRLEKIAEVRKTKKKKTNKDGELVYADYEENSAETSSTQKPESNLSPSISVEATTILTPSESHSNRIEPETTTPMASTNEAERSEEKTTHALDIFTKLGLDPRSSQKPKKYFNFAEYYDTTDEYDADYVTMAKLDLKRFTVPAPASRPAPPRSAEPRRPTVQYFPPRVNFNNADREFERKVNLFTLKERELQPQFVTLPPLPIATELPEPAPAPPRPAPGPAELAPRPPAELNENFYVPKPPTIEPQPYLAPGGRLDRGSYVIKHYKDFLNAAAGDTERAPDFLPPHLRAPPRGPARGPLADAPQAFSPRDDDDDYDARFRKEVLIRFVDNFNQNSERFKVDFPILYNNSIVHRKGVESPASSRTFLKRLYEGGTPKTSSIARKPCEPNCELTVELSPAYELHYYVPNQEEKEVQDPRGPAPRYGL